MAKGKGHPPIKPIDQDQLKALMRLKPTLKDTAAFFQVSEDTIERRVRQISGLTYADFRDQNAVHTRFALIRKAISMGTSGNVPMLIFCLKNQCGWADKPEEEVPKEDQGFQFVE